MTQHPTNLAVRNINHNRAANGCHFTAESSWLPLSPSEELKGDGIEKEGSLTEPNSSLAEPNLSLQLPPFGGTEPHRTQLKSKTSCLFPLWGNKRGRRANPPTP